MTQQDRDLPTDVVKTSEVIDRDVKNRLNENLGKIEEIVLDKNKGNVRYVVLSYDRFFGLSNKFFAIPWPALDYDANEDCFRLDIDKEKIKNAPSFDKDNWPNMADNTWGQNLYNYYGFKYDRF